MSPALLFGLWSLLFGSRKKIDVAAFTDASFDLLMKGLPAADGPSNTIP